MTKPKTNYSICTLVLYLFASSLCFGQTDTVSYSLEYLTDTLVLGAHPLSSQFRIKHNSVYVTRKSRELAATFDDPSRVLYRHVGISTANDQANGIIYHGLPSDFTKWTIHGAEIVNPNHTSNAGTFNDLSSQSAGGVLGIPFDVINTFGFHANTHAENMPSTLAGVANFDFLSKTENFFKLGLLGLELSLQSQKSKIPVKTHVRYSTVGLLGQLGVDFGGEQIAFTDGFFQASLTEDLDFISGGGFSSNIFRGVDVLEEAENGKALTDIDFNSYFFYSGLVFDKNRYKHTLMYSQKMDTRTSTSDFIDVFPRAEFANYKISYAGQIPFYIGVIDNFDVLINASFSDVNQSYPNIAFDDWRALANLSLRYTWFNDLYSFTGKAGPQIELNHGDVTPEFSLLATRQFNASSLEFGISYSSQEQNSETLGAEPVIGQNLTLARSKALNNSLTYKKEFNTNQKVLFRLFYHYFDDLPVNEEGYSVLLQIPSNREFENFNVGFAHNYGVELMYDHLLENDFYINANFTFFEFRQDAFAGGLVPVNLANELPPTNRFRYISNVNFSKSWELDKAKRLAVNLAFHLRGGAFDFFDIANPVQLKPYHRLDGRVQYEFKNSVLSLDIQNILNRRNDAFYFFDELLQERVLQQQLGLIPVLSWKRKF